MGNDLQEALSGQVRQLEAEMKKVQVIYPSFESVEARMKQYQHDITYNMSIMKEAFERHVEKMGASVKSLEASDKEFRSIRGKGKVYTPVSESEYREFKDVVWAKFQLWETTL